MSRLLLRPISYRHVVFPDSPAVSNRPVNFTPDLEVEEPDDSPQLSSDEYAAMGWIFERAGLNADDYRRETLRRRIPACLRALRVETMVQVCAAVQRNPGLLKVALNALVIGVTSFFRDPPVFAAIHERVIPELLSRTRSQGLRIWSAGCSDGSELYSVAMLVAEHGAVEHGTLLGTDCRPAALAQAREACYDTAAVSNVPASLFGKYFHFGDEGWRVHPSLRGASRWRAGELLRCCEPAGWDLILCRNLAIYMQPTSAQRLWTRLEHLLRPGGILVLGKAERPVGTKAMRFVAPCIYRRDRS
ncbi:MAG TPA: protein-glutamate O-methyltransferase CheR [Tepidisphaeraceae bacterium]|jgi:chemotaxis protein methyltransferase CheR|nr:protein-glutamate O-methyltransferase CheR [Tepidisphaeraceae bacterium]